MEFLPSSNVGRDNQGARGGRLASVGAPASHALHLARRSPGHGFLPLNNLLRKEGSAPIPWARTRREIFRRRISATRARTPSFSGSRGADVAPPARKKWFQRST